MSELLSPAGTFESFQAAIANGCDAVYLGIKKFNARAYANNFTIEELKSLVEFAHLRHVKVYVTMNTILYDEELKEAFETIDELADIHVDAIIVQDLALLKYICSHYKSLQGHVSTQMGIDDVYGAKLVKKIGATRIVFARETSLKVLKEVKDKVDIEIETFIHGALCVAYSGNCLMSSMIGERSGNRGRCAGCCRQLYSLVDTDLNKNIQTGYLLSMKDLNASSSLKELSFIDSFKIEGRMKEPTYVGATTYFYRRLMDQQKVNFDDINKVFNRTYTKGFMLGEDSCQITNIEKPNNFGYEIGKVVKINKDTIWIKLFKPLNKGDQIRIESKNKFEEISVPVLRLFDANFKQCARCDKIAIVSCRFDVDINAKVYKTKDVDFINHTIESFKRNEYKKLDIDFKFIAKVGQNPILVVKYQDYIVQVQHGFIIEKSNNLGISQDNIYKQLSKLNDTPYRLSKLKIEMDDRVFLPLKILNELRRDAIVKLNEKRLYLPIIKKEEEPIAVRPFSLLKKPIITVQVSNDEQYEVAKQLGIKHIYYHNIVNRNNADYVDNENEILIGGLGGIEKYRNLRLSIIGDYSLNVSNYVDAAILSSLGVERITISSEINYEHINSLVDNYYNCFHTYPNLELIVYGRAILMHSKYCVLKRLGMCGKCKTNHYALKDKFEQFPLQFNKDCTMKILNSKTLNIMDEINKVKGVNYFRLVFTNETPNQVKNIIETFEKIVNGEYDKKTFDNVSQTRGHFLKNAL